MSRPVWLRMLLATGGFLLLAAASRPKRRRRSACPMPTSLSILVRAKAAVRCCSRLMV